jgi:hypothetical protein
MSVRTTRREQATFHAYTHGTDVYGSDSRASSSPLRPQSGMNALEDELCGYLRNTTSGGRVRVSGSHHLGKAVKCLCILTTGVGPFERVGRANHLTFSLSLSMGS